MVLHSFSLLLCLLILGGEKSVKKLATPRKGGFSKQRKNSSMIRITDLRILVYYILGCVKKIQKKPSKTALLA